MSADQPRFPVARMPGVSMAGSYARRHRRLPAHAVVGRSRRLETGTPGRCRFLSRAEAKAACLDPVRSHPAPGCRSPMAFERAVIPHT